MTVFKAKVDDDLEAKYYIPKNDFVFGNNLGTNAKKLFLWLKNMFDGCMEGR